MGHQEQFNPSCLNLLSQCTGISDAATWKNIFFLISKSEHDNEIYDDTFKSAYGGSVFTYAEALRYDYSQRGVTLGIVGFTTANSGKASWGDAQNVFRVFRMLGGPDLLPMSMQCHTNRNKAKALCRVIASLSESDVDRFIQAQMTVLCRPHGYIFETAQSIGNAEIPPTPLMIVAVFDSMLNFGLGGRYCPKKWLEKHAVKGNQRKTLTKFLRWKKKVSKKNHHNSCAHNARCRSNMFKKLMKRKQWNIPRDACERVVQWTMK